MLLSGRSGRPGAEVQGEGSDVSSSSGLCGLGSFLCGADGTQEGHGPILSLESLPPPLRTLTLGSTLDLGTLTGGLQLSSGNRM